MLIIKDKDDTGKANHLNKLCVEFRKAGAYDSAFVYGNAGLTLAQKIDFKKGTAYAYNNLGIVYKTKGDYTNALIYFFRSLEIDSGLGNKNGIARHLGNIGNVYSDLGDYPKALDFFLKTLTIDEQIGDKNGIEIVLGNIGIVYVNETDYPKARDYYVRALNLAIELKDDGGIARNECSLGNLYRDIGNYSESLEYYFKSLKICEASGDNVLATTCFGNIGTVYEERGDSGIAKGNVVFALNSCYPNALDFDLRALKISQSLDDKKGIAIDDVNIGSIYTKTGKYNDAFALIYTALRIDDSLGLMNALKSDYELLSSLYENSTSPLHDSIGGKLLNPEQMRLRSIYYYRKFVSISDTLFSQENKKQLVRKEMNYEFDKKQTKQKADQNKKDALAQEQLKQKETQRNYFIAGFALVLALAGFIFRSYRQKQKANEIISQQKELVEEKQKEILDSIHYAKRIQQSLLPNEKYISKNLFPRK
ncbi:MAG: tetratricopeptide repeat protein [Bacteroidetes bacterium]|nr:tetratricopeptide repeat protein [Bacteroidota bacterium]